MKKKKILIIALAQSTHTHAWTDLISKKKFDVRLFGVKNSHPDLEIDTFYYSLGKNFPFLNPKKYNFRIFRKFRRLLFYYDYLKKYQIEKNWLEQIIKNWQPDIIHTLGIDPSTLHLLDIRSKLKPYLYYQWVVTIRGGSDIELERFSPEGQKTFKKIFQECDFVFTDNIITYSYALELGLDKKKKPPWKFIPGTGGIDIQKLSNLRKGKTSQNRIILWPKACEATYSKGLSVLEAIKIAWPKIKPCQIIMTVVDPNFLKWLELLPAGIRQSIKTYPRIPRAEILKIIAKSRVILLPSLIDGIPNSLYEAMACKTFPIVSPLKTIKTIVGTKNVLFARNLYPQEIADALIKAMNDDKLIDESVANNLRLVKKIANRQKITGAVNDFYWQISKEKSEK